MALEQIAGPFPVLDRITGSAPSDLAPGGATWIDGRGLAIRATVGGQFVWGTIQMDGAFYGAWNRAIYYKYGLALTGEAADPAMRRRWHMLYWTYGIGPYTDWTVDPVSLFAGATHAEFENPPGTSSARLHDRYLTAFYGYVRASQNGLNWTAEAPIPIDSYPNFLSWGAAHSEIIIGDTAGNACRYDWLSKAAVGPVAQIGMACLGLWYSARHRVYISLHGTSGAYELRIWAETPRPASISAPQAEPAPQPGRRSKITARVLGAHGEPCAGEVVAWTLTGPGTLALAATETDAAGWAATYYDAPLAATGDAQIGAEVAY